MAVHTGVPETPEENPLVEGLERLPVPPTALVIFGATGDLAHRKLLPALYNLAHEGALPERFKLVGVARREKGHDDFAAECRESIVQYSRRTPDDAVLDGLLEHVTYVASNFDDPEGYKALRVALDQLDEDSGQPLNRTYYLSTAPEFFPVIVEQLKGAGLHKSPHADVRVVIEKPFGTDLKSARELQGVVSSVFRESQVFRIDHYLGKETVQNVMAFRFANMMFEPIWNRNYIDHIQITGAEDIGIGTRAGYYDHAGALRDLVQNHMLQLVALTCMEPPSTFDADKVRDEKTKVLDAITPPDLSDTVRAQYTAGVSGGEDAVGYLQEEGVPDDSHTETYAALKLEVHNWRWAGVPIFLRTGKRLARKVTEIAVQLKPVPHLAFQSQGSVGVQPNQLILTVQPNEGVSLSLGAKIPGSTMRIRPVNMEFLYGSAFMSQSPGGLRAADHGRDARRRHAVHPQRRGRRAVADHRPGPRGLAQPRRRRAAGDVHVGLGGPGGGRRADRRPAVAQVVSEDVWSARDTTPSAIEAALRELLGRRYQADRTFVPARVMNLVVVVDRGFRGEVENRLARVGRYHPSRLVIAAVDAGRTTLDAWATVAAEDAVHKPGHIAIGRERVEVEIGPQHVESLAAIVDPLLVPDLATMVWAPHGHEQAVEALRRLANIVLVDTQDDPQVTAAFARAADLTRSAYVVDLAWLRSTPWRERIAASFDPPEMRRALRAIDKVVVRHRADSTAAGVLFCGWLASRLRLEAGGARGARRRRSPATAARAAAT